MHLRLLLVLSGSVALSACFVDTEDPEVTSAASSTSTGAASSSGSTGEPADSSSGGESTGAVDLCPEYCGLVQDVCSEEFEQYQSEEICLAVCAALPPGMSDDQLGNSAACRRFQAVQATESATTFCGAAGPTGDGTCGAACETFCGLAMELCTDDMAQWSDIPSCITDCMMFPPDVEYNSMVIAGDSYACRMYHLTVASLDPVVHCPHIGLDSPVCL